jgi:hypothetical protein
MPELTMTSTYIDPRGQIQSLWLWDKADSGIGLRATPESNPTHLQWAILCQSRLWVDIRWGYNAIHHVFLWIQPLDRLQHMYHGQPYGRGGTMLEPTLSPSQGLRIWPRYSAVFRTFEMPSARIQRIFLPHSYNRKVKTSAFKGTAAWNGF